MLEVGKLSRQFRLDAWERVDASIARGWGFTREVISRKWFKNTDDGQFWKEFVRAYFKKIHEIPHDQLPLTDGHFFGDRLRSTILDGDVDDILVALEFMFRTHGMPHALQVDIKHIFEKSPYFLDASTQPICIMPSVSEDGKKAMQRSLDALREAGMTELVNHLRNSAQHINEGKYVDSLRESILAIEWAACKIAGTNAPLGAALNILEKQKLLTNAQLKSGFEKLYAYTNNIPGARHANAVKAKVFEDAPPPEMDEALFMYGACASFAAYLASKQRKIKK